MTTTHTLTPGLKIKLVHGLLSGQSLHKLVDDLPTEEIAAAVRFVYEKTVECGILTLGKALRQEELLLTGHQFNLPADEHCRVAHSCKPLDCGKGDNDCARRRLIVQIDRLGQLARTLLLPAA